MNTQINDPSWWTSENDSAWERTKAAFKRDWDQTKHDMGGDAPNTTQNAKDTLKQAAGKEPIPPRGVTAYDQAEPAYRFGYGARSHYREKYNEWDDDVEDVLRQDWENLNPDRNWDEDAEYIRTGWDYAE